MNKYREEVRNIINDLRRGDIGWVKAQDKICALLDVVGQSEQLVCVHPYKDVYQSETECYCEKCGEDLTEVN